jgi:hypothetical protein
MKQNVLSLSHFFTFLRCPSQKTREKMCEKSVLRIWDPALFWPKDPGSGIIFPRIQIQDILAHNKALGAVFIVGSGSGIRNEIQPDPGSGMKSSRIRNTAKNACSMFNTFFSGSSMQNFNLCTGCQNYFYSNPNFFDNTIISYL